MPLQPYACSNCGHWQRYFAEPPNCPICTDVRNDLPEDGWHFRQPASLALQHHWRTLPGGIHEFWATPRFGLDSHGWVLETAIGNVAFEAAPFYDTASLDRIAAIGGLATIAASHPHGYGALWQLQQRFACPVLIQKNDLPWTKAFRVTHPYDENHSIAPGLTLHRTGGHYDGHAILHDASRGAVFAGDALKLDLDEHGRLVALSCHKAYHKAIPLSPDEARHYRAVFGQLEFDTVFTPFECARDVPKAAVLALFDRMIAGIGDTHPVLLAELCA